MAPNMPPKGSARAPRRPPRTPETLHSTMAHVSRLQRCNLHVNGGHNDDDDVDDDDHDDDADDDGDDDDDDPRGSPRGAQKTAPGRPKVAPRWPKTLPRRSQAGPKRGSGRGSRSLPLRLPRGGPTSTRPPMAFTWPPKNLQRGPGPPRGLPKARVLTRTPLRAFSNERVGFETHGPRFFFPGAFLLPCSRVIRWAPRQLEVERARSARWS